MLSFVFCCFSQQALHYQTKLIMILYYNCNSRESYMPNMAVLSTVQSTISGCAIYCTVYHIWLCCLLYSLPYLAVLSTVHVYHTWLCCLLYSLPYLAVLSTVHVYHTWLCCLLYSLPYLAVLSTVQSTIHGCAIYCTYLLTSFPDLLVHPQTLHTKLLLSKRKQ